jgi:parallel beta-helix repeat protein
VVYVDDSAGSFSGNDLGSSGGGGIQVGGSAHPSIGDNTIDGSSGIGLLYLESARGTASGNRVRNHDVGIQAVDQSAPTVQNNTLSGISDDSIVWVGAAEGSITGNTCASGAGGIVLANGASPQLGSNDCSISSRS